MVVLFPTHICQGYAYWMRNKALGLVNKSSVMELQASV